MLATLARPLVRIFDRYLPDPFVFVLILTLVVFACAMLFEGQGPITVLQAWGDGFWNLLSFSMQMLLVLVTGFMLASTAPVKRLLVKLAAFAKTPAGAVTLVSVVSLAASWINWGFGLVVGALFAREVARQIQVDYRLLVAAAYSGFVVWHGGLAGSIPLSISTPGHPFEAQMGQVGTGETIFSFFNLAIVAALFIVIPLTNRWMVPKPEDSVFVDSEKLADSDLDEGGIDRPADRLETARPLGWIIGGCGLIYLLMHFGGGGGITLDIINLLFLSLAIALHGSPRRALRALQEAVQGGAGIVIQFPFYAGIMGVMVGTGLAASISDGLVSLASAQTLPFWSFLSAGIVNFFVPSGGGQWAVQAPVVIPAAEALGSDLPRVAMAVAWGDAWTNLVQPFWALAMLGIAGLKAKDIMGFCVMHLLLTGVVISAGLVWL